LTKIFTEDLGKDLASALAEFMMASLPSGAVDIHGNIVDLNGLTNKKIKFLLHKFLHSKGLTEFGVIDTAGVFKIIHLKPEEKKEHTNENLKASMPYSPLLANTQGRPLYAPWMKPSDMIEWQSKPVRGKKTRGRSGG
jgi:hypothetical protein